MMDRTDKPCRRRSCTTIHQIGALLCLGLVLLLAACTARSTTEHLYALGETAEVDGWQVTLHGFSLVAGDSWRQPAAGHVFCAVELTLKNTSSQIRFVMPEKQMQLLAANRGYALDYEAGVMAARSRQWFVPQGEVDPSIELHGAAAYEIPADSQDLRWVFRSGLFPWSKKVVFALGELPHE